MSKIKEHTILLLSYCGLYCGACPSYYKGTCLGCRSEDKAQNRKSKWNCKIRKCCINEKEVQHCGECSDFICALISKKLIDSHPNNYKFHYRHEIPNNLDQIINMNANDWLKRQEEKWKCEECGGDIVFYQYKCMECEKKYNSGLTNQKGG